MEPPVIHTLESLLPALAGSARVSGRREAQISGLAIDSRAVRPGDCFVALRGERTDGHRFIADAVARGASVVVVEDLIEIPASVSAVVVPDTARAASQIAGAFYGEPSASLAVAGVTGTNGKTTTTQMVAAMLNAGGIPCASLGTIGADFREKHWPLENTTPLAPALHALLAQMRDLGAKAAAMEVSSHALALQRVADVRFHVGALTNVTRDHLDFHGTFDAYAGAKRKLFEQSPRCVLNADDALGERWAAEFTGRKPVTTYAIAREADIHPRDLDVRADGSSFALDGERFEVRLPGTFNVANALCALGVTRSMNVADGDAARGLSCLERVAGRMEHVRGAGIDVVVDYAHTPDALENVLRALREIASGQLIAVFGCGGDRDRGKRAQMGAVSAHYADFTFVTSDNPRGEDPQSIIDEVLAGVGDAPHRALPDRRAAIEAAVGAARRGDVVLVAGKGHENYQIIGTRVLPFDDVSVARETLAARTAVSS